MAKSKWETAVSLAKHYKAIGQTRVYLNEGPYPFKFVDTIEDGGMHRNGISVSLSFKAEHPCGLTFSWHIDLEKPEANGQRGFVVDVERLRKLVSEMPSNLRPLLTAHFYKVAKIIAKQATETAEWVENQQTQALALEGLAERSGKRIG